MSRSKTAGLVAEHPVEHLVEQFDHRSHGACNSRFRSRIRAKHKRNGVVFFIIFRIQWIGIGLALLLYSSRKPEHASLAVYALW